MIKSGLFCVFQIIYSELFNPFRMEYAIFIGTFISMGAKIVTLRLNQVGRENGSAIAIIIRHCGSESWYRNTILNRISHDITQSLLVVVRNFLEVRSQQQVSNLRIFGIGISNFLQELSTDNAACTENFGDLAVVQIPVVLFRCRTQL